MQEQCTAFSERLLGLAQEWDTHRLPLVEALSEKEDILNKVETLNEMYAYVYFVQVPDSLYFSFF